MDRLFKALADPGRRRMLAMLRRRGRMDLGEIAAHFELSLPTLSSHMRVLTDADLVLREKEGRHVYFSINTSVLEDAVSAVFELVPEKDGERQREESLRRILSDPNNKKAD